MWKHLFSDKRWENSSQCSQGQTFLGDVMIRKMYFWVEEVFNLMTASTKTSISKTRNSISVAAFEHSHLSAKKRMIKLNKLEKYYKSHCSQRAVQWKVNSPLLRTCLALGATANLVCGGPPKMQHWGFVLVEPTQVWIKCRCDECKPLDGKTKWGTIRWSVTENDRPQTLFHGINWSTQHPSCSGWRLWFHKVKRASGNDLEGTLLLVTSSLCEGLSLLSICFCGRLWAREHTWHTWRIETRELL